jgi:hypothetical protein
MSNQTEILAAERARALAIILLTNREDLRIIEPKAGDPVIHFLVEIDKSPRAALRTFGVVWDAQIPPSTDVQANRALKPILERLAGVIEYTFPVCLFYFTMQDDRARYTWVAEPVVGADDRPDLVIRRDARCSPLDPEAINAIVVRVEAWYDARSHNGEARTLRRSRSGSEVVDAILNAQADYVAAHGKEPTTLHLPLLMAFDLAKLGREGLGDLAQTLMLDGVRALEGRNFFGMNVHLVRDSDTIGVE